MILNHFYPVVHGIGGLLMTFMHTLKFAFPLRQPGPFMLITLALDVLMTYYTDYSVRLYDRYSGFLDYTYNVLRSTKFDLGPRAFTYKT